MGYPFAVTGFVIFLRRALLVLGVALLVLWPVSHLIGVRINRPISGGDGVFRLHHGALRFSHDFEVGTTPPPANLKWIIRKAGDPWNPAGGFDFGSLTYQGGSSPTAITSHGSRYEVPLFVPAAACLLWPAIAFYKRRKQQPRGFDVETADDSGATTSL